MVFSAGDDVMAVGSPSVLFDFLKQIRRLWDFKVGGGLSGAVGIFHVKSSLRRAITWVEEGVKRAKKCGKQEKNTLLLAYHPRGGNPSEVFLKEGWIEQLEKLESLYRSVVEGKLPLRVTSVAVELGKTLSWELRHLIVSMLSLHAHRREFDPKALEPLAEKGAAQVLRGLVRTTRGLK